MDAVAQIRKLIGENQTELEKLGERRIEIEAENRALSKLLQRLDAGGSRPPIPLGSARHAIIQFLNEHGAARTGEIMAGTLGRFETTAHDPRQAVYQGLAALKRQGKVQSAVGGRWELANGRLKGGSDD